MEQKEPQLNSPRHSQMRLCRRWKDVKRHEWQNQRLILETQRRARPSKVKLGEPRSAETKGFQG